MGEYFEVTGVVITKYYGGKTAMWTTTRGLTYLLADHLGSNSLITNDNGTLLSETRYKPWGEIRYTTGTTTTPYTYTGQYSNTADFGWMYYKARWYDTSLGRFNQPDSIVPGAGDPRAWDRYSYVKNSPVGYSDPTGHRVTCGDGEAGGCGGRTAESEYFRQRTEQKRCEAGNSSSCSYAQNHPVETAAFVVTGLVGAGAVGAGVAPAKGSAAAVAKGATYLEGANIACGGDMCSDEINTGINSVYRVIENGKTIYVGITKNLAQRSSYWSSKNNWMIEPIDGLTENLSKFDVRAVEQVLLEHYKLQNLVNRINSIAVSNPIYNEAITRGTQLLNQIGFFGQ